MRVVVICCNPVLARLVLPALRHLGARVALVCEAQARHIGLSRICDRVILESDDLASENLDRVAGEINNLAQSEGVDCVLACDVTSSVVLSNISKRLVCPVFPVSSADTLRILDNKWSFHKICQGLGVEVPRTLHYTRKADIDPEQIATSIGYSIVVKPVEQWSSAGVAVVDTVQQLHSDVICNSAYVFEDLVVQEYVAGEDGGFGGLAVDGQFKCWTTFVLPSGGGVEFTPLPLLLRAAEKIVSSLRFSGVINFDARVNIATGAVSLIECNPRFFVRIQASRLCGLDFVRAGLPLGRADIVPPQPQSLTHGRFMPLAGLKSWSGVGQVVKGSWQRDALLHTISEILQDPLPLIAENMRLRFPRFDFSRIQL